MPVPVAARSKAWVCGRSPAQIMGSNPAGGMDVCLSVSCVVCCHVEQCFSTFVRFVPGYILFFFLIRRDPGPNKFTRKYLSNLF